MGRQRIMMAQREAGGQRKKRQAQQNKRSTSRRARASQTPENSGNQTQSRNHVQNLQERRNTAQSARSAGSASNRAKTPHRGSAHPEEPRKTASAQSTVRGRISASSSTAADSEKAKQRSAQTGKQRPAWMRAASGFFGTDIKRAEQHREREERSRREPRTRQDYRDPENYDTPVAAHKFSGKFVGILMMVVVLLLGTAYPLTNYVDQQREINTTRARIAELKQENVHLEAEKTWWQDDDYVRQQARSRLFYVAPGDTPYTVTGLDEESTQADSTSATGKNAPDDSWTNKLWGSLNDGKTPAPQQPESR